MIVAVAVHVIVAAPVIVAVHLNGTAPVAVIDRRKRPVPRLHTRNPGLPAADISIVLSFQQLDVYKRSIEFLAFVHRLLARLPKGHAELADQLRRSAQSTPQNIAEGAGRMSKPDKARHYAIARGSAMESAAHLDVMRIDGLLDDEEHAVGTGLLERVVAMLTKLIGP